jgi:hypothetical protein
MSSQHSEPRRPRPTRRKLGAGLLVGVAAAATIFAGSLAAVTLVETVKGSPLSGGDSGGLSVLGGNTGTDSKPVVEVPVTTTQVTEFSTVTQTVTSEPTDTAPVTSQQSATSPAVLESGVANHRILTRGVGLGVDRRDHDSEPGSLIAGGRRGQPFGRRRDRDRVGGRHRCAGQMRTRAVTERQHRNGRSRHPPMGWLRASRHAEMIAE